MKTQVVNPARWLETNNDMVWRSFHDAAYRPGKLAEFHENIHATASALRGRSGFTDSARRLAFEYRKRILRAGVDIVCAGPSLPDQVAEIEERRSRFKIVLNAATRYVRPFMVVWGERTADPKDMIDWNNCFKKTWMVASMLCHPRVAEWPGRLVFFNHGTADGIGAMAREAWTVAHHPSHGPHMPMLELPGMNDSFELALMIAAYMGFKHIHLWGLDYCWYEKDGPYSCMPGSKPMDPETAHKAMESSGLLGVPPLPVLALNYQPYPCKDKNGDVVWTHYFLARRAERANYMIHTLREAGFTITQHTKRGLVNGRIG